MQSNPEVPKGWERERAGPHTRWSQNHPLGAIRLSPHRPANDSCAQKHRLGRGGRVRGRAGGGGTGTKGVDSPERGRGPRGRARDPQEG